MTDQLPPGARALLDEAVEKAIRVLPLEPVEAEKMFVAAGFLDLAARAERAERERDEADAESSRLEDDMLAVHDALVDRDDSDSPGINADGIVQRAGELRREVERLNRRNEEQEAHAALADLVRLKNGPRLPSRAEKDAAWERARAALHQSRSSGGGS